MGSCPVVDFAFLRLATNGRVYIHPLTVEEANGHVASWLARPNVRMLVAGPDHIFEAGCLLTKAGTAGNLVTDAQIAALALEYDATVHTADIDFARLAGVSWTNPLLEGT